MFSSIGSILSQLVTLRYAAALVLPDDETEAVDLLAFCYRLMFIVCIFVLAGIFFIDVSGASVTALELLGDWRWLLPVAVLLLGMNHINGSWLTRQKSFRTMSTSLVVGNSGNSGSRIAFGFTSGSTIYGLIIGELIGTTLKLVVQHKAVQAAVRSLRQPFDWSATKELASKYSDFPKFNAPAGLVFALGQNLPVLLFGAMFSPAAAGLYAMANRLSQSPVNIVATSVRRVFLQKAATIKNEGRSLSKAFFLSIATLGLTGILPFAGLWTFGQEIATWVLGKDWTEAGLYLEIIAPWLLMKWIAAPCNSIFVVLRHQRFWLLMTSLITTLRLGAFGIAYVLGLDPEQTLQSFVIASVLGIIATILMTTMLIGRNNRELAADPESQ